MLRLVGRAETVLPSLPSQSFDLVLTSPPAYPSLRQEGGSLGTEGSLDSYLDNLGALLFKCRRLIKSGGFLCLIIEPNGVDVMRPLRDKLQRLRLMLLATYHWNHGDGESWVVFLGRGRDARLNRSAPIWKSREWAIPRPPPDATYGFYEWPPMLVEAIVQLTIPNGGRILDPFAGKASALAALESPFEVVAVDVKAFDDEDSSPDENRVDALENPLHGGGSSATEETC